MGENFPGLSNYWGGIVTVLVVIGLYLFIRFQQGRK
jgi:hypothetical protein